MALERRQQQAERVLQPGSYLNVERPEHSSDYCKGGNSVLLTGSTPVA